MRKLREFSLGKSKQDDDSPSLRKLRSSRSPSESSLPPSSSQDLTKLCKDDFTKYLGKSLFHCGVAKAVVILDMAKDQVNVDDIIRDVETVYGINRPNGTPKGPDHDSGDALYIGIYHRYIAWKDSPQDTERFQQELFANIRRSCQRLQKIPVELAGDSPRLLTPYTPSTAPTVSVPHTPPLYPLIPSSQLSSQLSSQPSSQIKLEDTNPRNLFTPPQSERKSVSPPSEASLAVQEYAFPSTPTPQRTRTLSNITPSQGSPRATPACRICGGVTERRTTQSNKNGNRGKQYFKCLDRTCDTFHGWADREESRSPQPSFTASPSAIDHVLGTPYQHPASPSPIPEMQGMSLK